jgi:hypothetical protein
MPKKHKPIRAVPVTNVKAAAFHLFAGGAAFRLKRKNVRDSRRVM